MESQEEGKIQIDPAEAEAEASAPSQQRQYSSKYKGVSKTKYGTWSARVMNSGHRVNLGSFQSEQEAYQVCIAERERIKAQKAAADNPTSSAQVRTGPVPNTSSKPIEFVEELSSQLKQQMETLTDAELKSGDYDSENVLIDVDHLPQWPGNLDWDHNSSKK